MKLFLKGERCHTAKCAIAKRGENYPPGVHTWRKGRVSEYGRQLREKQRLKRIYGLYERQFRTVYAEANRSTGNTGESLLKLVERRLDNVVRAVGFGLGPASARQLVAHGHVVVNGKKVDRPSFVVKLNDVVGISKKERARKLAAANLERSKAFIEKIPAWLELNQETLEAKVLALPTREEFPYQIQEQLIVEGCAK
jgi:small subunit ribosomal protein S4